MKATINNNGKDVVIELTAEQEAYVKAQSENIMDRVKTFEDACKIAGRDPAWVQAEMTKDRSALSKLELIISVLNEGWKPDWGDTKEAKYYPLFDYVEDNFVLWGTNFYYQKAYISSRLCFKSSDLAEYAATQFQSLYNAYLQ